MAKIDDTPQTLNRLDQVQAYLDSVVEKTELSSFERDKVLALMSAPGFALLLGLLLTERQGQLMQLMNLKAGDRDDARRLGVLQGSVTGIDRAHQILLECATVPTDQRI